MTRARGDEEMSEEEKEEEEFGEEALDLEEGSFRKLVLEWNGFCLISLKNRLSAISSNTALPFLKTLKRITS